MVRKLMEREREKPQHTLVACGGALAPGRSIPERGDQQRVRERKRENERETDKDRERYI